MKSNNILISRLIILCVLVVWLIGGCIQCEPPDEARKLNKRLQYAAGRRQEIIREYKAMPVKELGKRLESDAAKGIEPFNSLAFRELVSRGRRVGRELKPSIRTADRSSFLTLLALRKVDMQQYKAVDPDISLKILIDALRRSKYFNAWGLPHLYWEDAAVAIIEHGPRAIEPLKGMLQDKRKAPVWGSEEVLEYQKYKYRVCDYAWAMLKEIKGEKADMPERPTVRDQMISKE